MYPEETAQREMNLTESVKSLNRQVSLLQERNEQISKELVTIKRYVGYPEMPEPSEDAAKYRP
jgi:hypothetical protein